MFNVLCCFLFIVILEIIFLYAQEIEVCKDEDLEDTNDITREEDISADDNVPASGNVAFIGQTNAKGSVKIFASSGGSAPFMQTTSFSQPFGETFNSEFNTFSPPTLSPGFPTSPIFLGPNYFPGVFFSKSSFPINFPYLSTRIQALETYHGTKLILLNSIRLKLANINFLPKVIISDTASDGETGCPMVQTVPSPVTSCPKMVEASPIALRLGQFASRFSAKNLKFISYPSLATNIGNIGLTIKASLELQPSEDLDGTDAIPINLLNTDDHSIPTEVETSSDCIDSVNNCDSTEEIPITNMRFSGVVPVAGSFQINAKF